MFMVFSILIRLQNKYLLILNNITLPFIFRNYCDLMNYTEIIVYGFLPPLKGLRNNVSLQH